MEDWKKDYEEHQAKYGKECQEELKKGGFKAEVTPEQAILILEPNHAPENFYCDGEISTTQAMSNWMERLRKAGLSPLQRVMARSYIFE